MGSHWPGSSANGDPQVAPNEHLSHEISVVWATTTDMEDKDDTTTTHLDSHANMVMAGRHATIISKSGKSADVRPFSKDCSKMMAVPIVDVAVAYDHPYSLKTYIFVMKNTLYVPSMNHNLVPPFILREAGLVVNDVSKI